MGIIFLLLLAALAKSRDTLKILWKGLKLATNNFVLLYPILLLSFLSSSLSFLLGYLCLGPLVLDLTKKSILIGNTDPKSPKYSLLLIAILKDLNELGLIKLVSLIISFIVISLVATAAVHVLSTAYSSKTPSSKLKEVFARLNWSLIKRCMITQLYGVFVLLGCSLMVLLTAVVLIFFSFTFTFTFTFTHSSSSSGSSYVWLMVIVALGVIVVAVLEVCLLLYLLMVVNTSVVVSVVEEGCYGLEAITKASKLIRGSRKQAILIALVELVVAEVLYAGYNLVMAPAAPVKMARLALGFGQVALGVLINVLTWSVQTVYYYECSAGHVEGIAMEGGFEYSPVPTQVNEALL